MVVNVLGSILFKSHKLFVQVAATGTVGFVAWRHTLAARMAEKHGDDHPLVLIAVDASVQAEKAVDCMYDDLTENPLFWKKNYYSY